MWLHPYYYWLLFQLLWQPWFPIWEQWSPSWAQWAVPLSHWSFHRSSRSLPSGTGIWAAITGSSGRTFASSFLESLALGSGLTSVFPTSLLLWRSLFIVLIIDVFLCVGSSRIRSWISFIVKTIRGLLTTCSFLKRLKCCFRFVKCYLSKNFLYFSVENSEA